MIKDEPEPPADAGSGGRAVPVLPEVAGAAPNRVVAALKYSAHAVDPVGVSMGIDIHDLKGCSGRPSGMSRPARTLAEAIAPRRPATHPGQQG